MSDPRDKEDFFEKVFAVVREIPPGRVTSYGAIAKFLGSGGSARTVGWAMNLSHQVSIPVPAHRVVNRNGQLTGKHHFSNANEMQIRLEAEGIVVKEDQIQNFKAHYWNPQIELGL
jgi:methylated-DNA-protein-cysteine methyltransferase-like protein